MATDSNESATGEAMRIAVIGAGNIGRTLGAKWATAGHEVVYGIRSPGAPDTASVAEAVASAEVVVLVVPGGRGPRARTGPFRSAPPRLESAGSIWRRLEALVNGRCGKLIA